jgi:hypothetical protein
LTESTKHRGGRGDHCQGLPYDPSKQGLSQAWWCTPVIPALWELRQEDLEFQTSLGYTVKSCFKKQNKIKQHKSTD